MEREYRFTCNRWFNRIDISKEGHEPQLEKDTGSKDFLWDENIEGIIFQQDVFSYGNPNAEETVRIRLAIIKDEDCQEFTEAARRYDEWEFKQGQVSSAIKIDDSAYQKILEMYRKAYQEAVAEIPDRIIQKMDMEYSMPLGQWEDTITLKIPIDISALEPDTRYRIGVYEPDGIPESCAEWLWFKFSRLPKPVEETFVPRSAYLKVRKNIRGKLYFDKAVNYRHYDGYFSDIHYDQISQEVEVNPALVCFELNADYDKEEFPPFNIILSSNGTVIRHDTCRLAALDEADRIVAFCPLSTEYVRVKNYDEITATLQAFGQTIASFTFSTKKTEKGEFKF